MREGKIALQEGGVATVGASAPAYLGGKEINLGVKAAPQCGKWMLRSLLAAPFAFRASAPRLAMQPAGSSKGCDGEEIS